MPYQRPRSNEHGLWHSLNIRGQADVTRKANAPITAQATQETRDVGAQPANSGEALHQSMGSQQPISHRGDQSHAAFVVTVRLSQPKLASAHQDADVRLRSP